MPAPANFSLHSSGWWFNLTDQSGPYSFDGVNMVLSTPSAITAASSGNVANASAVATLAGAAGKTTFITGFIISAAGATAGLVVNATVTGLAGGTATFAFAAPAGVLVAATPLVVNFPSPVPASAVNTAIVVTLPALGVGNTNASVTAFGFQR